MRLWFLLPLLFASGCFGLIREPYGTLTGRVTILVPGEPVAPPACVAPAPLATTSTTLRSIFPQMTPSSRSSASTGPGAYVVFFREWVPFDFADSVGREGLNVVRTGDGYAVLDDLRRRSFEEVEKMLLNRPEVEAVEPSGALYPLALPHDPELCQQWALFALRLPEAWDVVNDAGGLVVAVVDSGIDFSHPDLNHADLWETGYDFIDGVEYKFISGDRSKAAPHGTQVAGVISRLSGNGIGGAGVAWKVKLMPMRIFVGDDPYERVDIVVVADAIKEAVARGADVINLSLGCDPRACMVATWARQIQAVVDAVEYARSQGIAVVAAAGNYDGIPGPVMFPANHPGVIAVGAARRGDHRAASYSARGPELDVIAPGGERGDCDRAIHAPSSDDLHRCVAGTSFAAPHVSGVIALMLAARVVDDAEDAEILLTMTAKDLETPGWDPETGWGLVDAYAAVSAGVPIVFAAGEDASGRLVAAARPERPGVGGLYQLRGVPEGRWKVVAWYDKDGDGKLSPGDFYGEHPAEMGVRRGARLARLDIVMTPYEGPEREVVLQV